MQDGSRLDHKVSLWGVALLCLLFPILAGAQFVDRGVESAAPKATVEFAEVRVDDHLLFRVRGIPAYPAQRRAEEIAEKIEAIAADKTIDPASLRVELGADGRRRFFVGDNFQFGLVAADAELEGIPLDLLADVVRGRIGEVVVAYRHDRSASVVVRNIAFAVVLTLVLAAILFGLIRLFRWLDRLVAVRLKKQIESLEKKSLKLVQAQHIWGVLRQALIALRIILMVFVAYVYLNSVLSLFPLTREMGRVLLEMIVDPLTDALGAILSFIPSLVFLGIVIFVTRYLLRSIRSLFGALHRGSIRFENFEAEWAWPTYRLVRLAVIALAVVIAFPYIPGSDSGAFQGVSLFLGVLFSIGSTSVIANVVAGYTMTYRRAFRIGDRVRIGETVGEVAEMRLLVTHLRSTKNEEVIIPNSVILNSNVVNYSSLASENGLILHTTVGIGYEVPWRQVEAMLLVAAERTPGLLDEPKPFVLQTGLGDFAVNYELNAYCGDADHMPQLYSDLHRHIQDVFNEYSVQIMTPNYEADPAHPKLVPREHWYDAPAIGPRSDSSSEATS